MELNRCNEWAVFAESVYHHVRDYTLGQYGDKGEDLIAEKDAKYCIDQIERYCKRFGKGKRPSFIDVKYEQKLDMLKIAHYACMAWWKMEEQDEEDKGGMESTS